jgi:MYXO-CTERM domain-containing protein
LSVSCVTAGPTPLNCTISVLVAPAGSVAPAGNTTFTIRITPTASGPFTADFSVTNDDANENPYNISISGNGTAPGSVGGGGGGGGGGGCASSPVSTLPLAALVIMLAGVAGVRRRRA